MSSPAKPSVYAHDARPDWGRAVVAEELSDRTKYVFEHGGERTLMNEPRRVHEVSVPPDEREALATKLLRHHPQRAQKRVPRKKAAPVAEAMSFELQEEAFRARFPGGFASDKYLAEQRGADGAGVDALIATAQRLLSHDRLNAAIARKSYEDVYADALEVLAAAQKLAFPKGDKPAFTRMREDGHERFAIALRDLLYGTEPHAVRFNALVQSLGKAVPWTVATLFAAAVHPEEHIVVKALQSQRQARALGAGDPPVGSASGAGYAKHLAVARALRERLVAAGHTPRDLFDVYAYQWRTLSTSAGRTRDRLRESVSAELDE